MDWDAGYSDSYQPTVGYGASSTPHPDSASAKNSQRADKSLYKAPRDDYDRDRHGDRDYDRDRSYDRDRYDDRRHDDRRSEERRESRREERRSPARDDRRDRDRDRDGRREDRDRDSRRDERRDSRRDRDRDDDRNDRRDSRRSRDDNYEPRHENTVNIRGLPMLSGPDSVRETLSTVEQYVGKPVDVGILQIALDAKDTRRGAWVEMQNAEMARLLLSYGNLVVDGVTVELSKPVRKLTKEDLRKDWICLKCGAMNFSRRMECFQCGVPREGNNAPVDEGGSKGPAAGLNNDNVVIVRDLSEYVTEGQLRGTFGSFGQMREVRLVKDQYTQLGKGFAFVEFSRPNDAYKVVEESATRGIYVDNSRVTCGLAQGKDVSPKANSAVASAAIEAAMALNSARMSDGKAAKGGKREDDPTMNLAPPAEGFERDPSTGYFFNAETQQYYESATALYYTFKEGQCYFFDNTTQQYAACMGIGNPSAPVVEVPKVEVPKAKKKGSKPVATAIKKKAPKDMAAWAQATESKDTPAQQPAGGAGGNGMKEFKFEITNFNAKPLPPKKPKEATPTVVNETLPPPPSSAAVAKTGFICYLCNRKFNSAEMLVKHENLSDLHKKNLALATMKEKNRASSRS